MVDIEQAVRYPLDDEDWLKPIGIGGGIILVNSAIVIIGVILIMIVGVLTAGLGFLLFVPLMVIQFLLSMPLLGYNVRVLRSTIRGGNRLPQFTDWGSLLKDGLYATAVAIVYWIPLVLIVGAVFAAIVALAVVVGVGAGVTDAGEALVAGGSLLFILGQLVIMLVVFAYSLAIGYFFPISLSIYAVEDSLRAALSPSRIRRVGLTKEYALPWVIAIFGGMVVNQIAGFLVVLVVGVFLQFYVQVVMFRLFGLGYAEATGAAEGAPPVEGRDRPTGYPDATRPEDR